MNCRGIQTLAIVIVAHHDNRTIQDFPHGGANSQSVLTYYFEFFAENCMKMKEFGPWGRGECAYLAPPYIR